MYANTRKALNPSADLQKITSQYDNILSQYTPGIVYTIHVSFIYIWTTT